MLVEIIELDAQSLFVADDSHPDSVQELRATAQNPQSIVLEWKPPRTPGVFRYKVIH